MMSLSKPKLYKPTLIINGGYGHTRTNLSPSLYSSYEASLEHIVTATKQLLDNGASAVEAATSAVAMMEDDELFNAGRGSVFTRDGSIEMEASLCVTSLRSELGQTICAATSQLRHVKNPIKLAKSLLERAEDTTLQSHMSGTAAEISAQKWDLDIVDASYFWTKKRWEEHESKTKSSKDGVLVKGAVCCVCLDQWGDLAAASSSGGMAGREAGSIGGTATIGAGCFAETWEEVEMCEVSRSDQVPLSCLSSLWAITIGPNALLSHYLPIPHAWAVPSLIKRKRAVVIAASAHSNTMIRSGVSRFIVGMARFSPGSMLLQDAVTRTTGPGGILQRCAGHRWRAGDGDGESGVVWVEVSESEHGDVRLRVGDDYNVDGFWRAAFSGNRPIVRVFR